MNIVQAYLFEPKYKRDNGLLVLDIGKLPLPDSFKVQETSVVRLPAGEIAGNHKHPRQEAYICLDEGVTLHWLDENGRVHVENMASPGKLQFFVAPPHVPHAVVNASHNDATIVGYADGPLEDVEQVEVATPARL